MTQEYINIVSCATKNLMYALETQHQSTILLYQKANGQEFELAMSNNNKNNYQNNTVGLKIYKYKDVM